MSTFNLDAPKYRPTRIFPKAYRNASAPNHLRQERMICHFGCTDQFLSTIQWIEVPMEHQEGGWECGFLAVEAIRTGSIRESHTLLPPVRSQVRFVSLIFHEDYVGLEVRPKRITTTARDRRVASMIAQTTQAMRALRAREENAPGA
jgi:hypothetical protein